MSAALIGATVGIMVLAVSAKSAWKFLRRDRRDMSDLKPYVCPQWGDQRKKVWRVKEND